MIFAVVDTWYDLQISSGNNNNSHDWGHWGAEWWHAATMQGLGNDRNTTKAACMLDLQKSCGLERDFALYRGVFHQNSQDVLSRR